MASDPNDARVTVSRSGNLYLLSKGDGPRDPARTVDAVMGRAGPVLPLGTLLAHLHVVEPWADVPEADRPENVQTVVVADWPEMVEP